MLNKSSLDITNLLPFLLLTDFFHGNKIFSTICYHSTIVILFFLKIHRKYQLRNLNSSNNLLLQFTGATLNFYCSLDAFITFQKAANVGKDMQSNSDMDSDVPKKRKVCNS